MMTEKEVYTDEVRSSKQGRQSWGSMSSKKEVREKMNLHLKEIEKAEEQGEYLEPFPFEFRREFWKYGLNPITGMPTPGILDQEKLRAYRKNSKEDE